MFQPQPTPFSPFASTYGVNIPGTSAGVPDYSFQPTPLGLGHSNVGGSGTGPGCGGSGGPRVASSVGSAGPNNAAAGFPSAVFHSNHHLNTHFAYNNNNTTTTTTNTNNTLPHTLDNHNFHSRNHQRQRQRHQQQRGSGGKMESQQSDIAQQEAAARDYKPKQEGPLVGNKTSSHAITQEYAQADPVFVAKTMALPQTYPYFRPIQGDGNCGWRAIGFGYFENLVRCGDLAQVQAEMARLTSFNQYIENVGGYDVWLMEEMTSETFTIFEEIIATMSSGQDPANVLIAKFNDAQVSPAIVYHLRLLVASWMKGNYAEFEPFLHEPVISYVEQKVLPVDMEIEDVPIKALFDVLLKPASIGLEIVNLDRTEGSEANVIRMSGDTNSQDPAAMGLTIHLLYRPGHYDILYQEVVIQAPPVPVGPSSLQVNRATSFSQPHEFQSTGFSLQQFSTLNMNALAMIPRLDSATLVSTSASSPMTDPYAPSPQSTWVSPGFPDALPTPPPAPQQPSPPQQQPTSPTAVSHPLRFSKYNFPNLPEMAENNTNYEPTFTTNTFKNSHFNVAHYSNNNFQPEMYRPEAEDASTSTRSGGRKRSSEHCAGVKK